MTKDKIIYGLFDFQPLLEIQASDNEIIIYGTYQVNELILGENYFGNFDVKISCALKYPQEIPIVYVYGNKLDKCEHRYNDGMLCLEAEHNLKAFLRKKPTLKEFVIKFLTPFLVGFLHYEKYGEYLFGERKHGDSGIIEMYQDRFNVKNISIALQLLKIVALKTYRGHISCPCNSGEKIRKCHGKHNILINMINSPDYGLYQADYNTILTSHKNRQKKESPKNTLIDKTSIPLGRKKVLK